MEILNLADITEKTISLLAQYSLSHGLKMPDVLIASTALYLDQSFITKSQRDYCFINGLRLLPCPLP